MIKLFYIAFLLVLTGQPCPKSGDNKNPKMMALDNLKNRSALMQGAPQNILISAFLKPGNDVTRFKSSQFVTVTGYIFHVKYGGAETCDCHSKNKADLDYHIEVAADKNHTAKNQLMIWEVNRFNKIESPALTYEYVQSLIGKTVTVTGWLFFDEEHTNASENTHPGGKNDWRATAWEIHSIKSLIAK